METSLGFVSGPMKNFSCTYSASLNCWLGRLYCDYISDAPVSIAVVYTDAAGQKRTIDQPPRFIPDPSGTVYEGVVSNALEGVKTTLYYKTIVSGIEHTVEWDASDYGQVNPVFTDSNGYYEWFVPDGLWMVKYEKDGYFTAYSDWMEIPPPRTEVNIGLISMSSPEISGITAYAGFIDIVFNQYMKADPVPDIIVAFGGVAIEGTVTPVGQEVPIP